MLRAFICVLAISLLLLAPSFAFAGDEEDYQKVIAGQLQALQADDGTTAYSFAAPSIKMLFPSPEIFMSMVKNGYPQVYRPQSYKFAEITTDPFGRPAQHVTIIDGNGKLWTAVYTMERQADGTWKIAGCSIIEAPGADA
ncbi:DUF4864 domain-containing protein [soil metagenome]